MTYSQIFCYGNIKIDRFVCTCTTWRRPDRKVVCEKSESEGKAKEAKACICYFLLQVDIASCIMCARTLLRNVGMGLLLRRQPLQTLVIRSKMAQPNDNDGSNDIHPLFNPRKAVVLTKISRFDYERRRCQSMTEAEFRSYVC